MYKASKENVQATDTTWSAYWRLSNGKMSNVQLVGNPFAYDPETAWGGKAPKQLGKPAQSFKRVKFYRKKQ